MRIGRLDCLTLSTRPACAATKERPGLDLLRANPVGRLLIHLLAPGVAPRESIAWSPSKVCTTLKLGEVHCETVPGAAHVRGKRCIVAFHGNSADAESMLADDAHLRNQADLLAVNAPGYGHTPAPKNHRDLEWCMAANVRAVATWVAERYAPEDVLWLGYSLGGAQAAMGFQEMPGSHLLLESTFTSVRDVVQSHVARLSGVSYAWLNGMLVGCGMAALPRGWRIPGSAFVTDGLDTQAKLRHCATTHRAAGSKVGVISAECDEIMAPWMAERLWRAYHGTQAPRDAVLLHCLVGAGHNGMTYDAASSEQSFDGYTRATSAAVKALFGAGVLKPDAKSHI